MLDAIVQVVMSRVGELLCQNINDFKNFKSTFDSLQRSLTRLIARASDIDDEIQLAEISGRRKRKREVEEWLKAVKSIETEFSHWESEVASQGFMSRFLGGGGAERLNESVDYLIKQSQQFGGLLLPICETMGEALLTTSLIGNTPEENLEKIWKLVSTDKVPRLGIHGMGGVGKTTLAKHTNNRLVELSEERVIWVEVSQSFNFRELQDEIARVVRVDLSDEKCRERRAVRLWQALSKRKNILILDDVWERIDLEDMGYQLSKEGFRLIITTRSETVCRSIGCSRNVVLVKTLTNDEAWELFCEKLDTGLDPQVEKIAKCIAKMCCGLPLGIILLAGSMRGKTTIRVWRNALGELKENSGIGGDDIEKDVFEVLRCSFDQLNPNNIRQSPNVVQLCFLFCSLYPEACEISKEELVERFISDGLMDDKKRRRRQVDQAHCILNQLVDVCLLERCADRVVRMHNTVRRMALQITEGTTMVKAGHESLKKIPSEEEWTKDLEKVSLMRNGIEEIPPEMSPNCPKLSTLLLSNNPLKFLPDSFFLQMHGLCTLDLSHTGIEKLPDSLSTLVSLKALLLRSCERLVHVPCLGNLKALTELDLSQTAIKELPSGIEELVGLRFLSIDAQNLEICPGGLLLKYPKLECLKLPNHLEAPMGEIEMLEQLEEFKGRLKNVRDFNRFIRSRAYDTDTVYDVSIGHASPEPARVGDYDHRVRLRKYNLRNGEEEDEAVLGDDIGGLSIVNYESPSHVLLDDFRRLLGNWKCLKNLQVAGCKGIECFVKGEQMMEEALQELQSLEELLLEGLEDLKGIITMEEREIVASPPSGQPLFSCLKRLSISNCRKIKKLGLPVTEFHTLEEISVYNCREIEEIVEVGRGEGEARSVSLPKLKKLELRVLPRLQSICSNVRTKCASIETINLCWCPGLKKFPLEVDPLPEFLRQIWIAKEEDWTSLEWEDSNHPLLLQRFLIYL